MKINNKIIDKFKKLCNNDENLFNCLRDLFVYELDEKGHFTEFYDNKIKTYSERRESANNQD